MKTNMNELSINELEQVNGGSLLVASCIVGVAVAAVKVADLVYDYVKEKKKNS